MFKVLTSSTTKRNPIERCFWVQIKCRTQNEPFKFYGKNHNQRNPQGQGFSEIFAHTQTHMHMHTNTFVAYLINVIIHFSLCGLKHSSMSVCKFSLHLYHFDSILANYRKSFFTFVSVWRNVLSRFAIKSVILFDFSLLPTSSIKTICLFFSTWVLFIKFIFQTFKVSSINRKCSKFELRTNCFLWNKHKIHKIIKKELELHSHVMFGFQSRFAWFFVHIEM